MSAPPILRGVYQDLQANWGPENDGYLFDNGPSPVDRLDVVVYRPTDAIAMTSFATIGMAIEEMPAPSGRSRGLRAELRFARRGSLDKEQEQAIARQLANIAIYPWRPGGGLDWGHMVGLVDDFPTFPGCRAVFLSGPFVPDGQDCVRIGDEVVRIMNVVPITEAERERARTMLPGDFFYDLLDSTDVFSARTDTGTEV
ncbi:suppressor of fused domain protein [Nocardia vinacea]|uniref:suppressor of fused domain protein n=1 Tax=Nocardia vinacea TaxID=96468 RepID=UPI002E0E56F5|nr:suppressor of fused domain protein [Nocardia vinacea]